MTSNFRNDGWRFERIVDGILTQYAARGWMRVKKVEQPIRVFKNRVAHLENPFLDYIGAWTERGGMTICIEVKSTLKTRLPLGAGGLTARQQEEMHKWALAGAAVILLWECGGAVGMWTMASIEFEAQRRHNLDFEDRIIVPAGTGFIIYDFRSVMLGLWPSKSQLHYAN